jgi:hypothetical protein
MEMCFLALSGLYEADNVSDEPFYPIILLEVGCIFKLSGEIKKVRGTTGGSNMPFLQGSFHNFFLNITA